MQGQRNEQEWVGGGQGDDLESSPHAALVELSARVVFVELVELVREALLQVEDLADYAVHGGNVMLGKITRGCQVRA